MGRWRSPPHLWGGGGAAAGGAPRLVVLPIYGEVAAQPPEGLSPRHPPPPGSTQDPDLRRLVFLLPSPDRLAPALVLVQVGVGGLVHGLPVLAGPPRRDAHTDLDVLGRAHAEGGVFDRTAQADRNVARAV